MLFRSRRRDQKSRRREESDGNCKHPRKRTPALSSHEKMEERSPGSSYGSFLARRPQVARAELRTWEKGRGESAIVLRYTRVVDRQGGRSIWLSSYILQCDSSSTETSRTPERKHSSILTNQEVLSGGNSRGHLCQIEWSGEGGRSVP